MIGRSWRVPLGLLISLNNAFGPNAAFAASTVLAIAASVALSTSLEMTSRAVQAESERTADALAGSAQLELVGGELGVPEDLVSELASVPGVLSAAPLINATVHVDGLRMPLHVLGIDLTLAADSRELDVREAGVRVNDPLRLLVRPDSVLIGAALARRIGTALGGSLTVRSNLGAHELRVEGLLEEEGLASAFNGQVAVMDVYALQSMLRRQGVVDRIDVVAQPGYSVGKLAAELETRVGGAATVRRVGHGGSALDQTVAALRVAVLIVAAVGALVSGLLCYAAMSTAVERRLQEFTILRSTGISARSIASWVALEAGVTGGIGTGIGLIAGACLAGRLVPILSKVSEYFSASAVGRSDVAITGTTVALAIAVGLVCTLCGAIGPTRLATRRYTLGSSESIPGQRRAEPRSRTFKRVRVAVTAVVVGAAALPCVPAALRTLLVLGLGVGVVIRSAIPALGWLDRSRATLCRMIPGTGHLMGTGLRTRPGGTALAVGAIAALVAFVHGAIIVSASFSETLLALVSARYPDGILVTAGAPFVDRGPGIIRPDVVESLRTTPGVDTTIERFSSTILVRGEEVSIVAFPADIPAAHAGTLPRLDDRLRDALVDGDLAMSGAFARKFGLRPGDSLELSTPRGRRSFRIAGELTALAGPAGVIFVDLATFDRVWERPGATLVYVWIARDHDVVIDEIRRRTGDRQDLFFTNGNRLLAEARTFAARFDGLLYGVGTLAIVLGAISIANLLAGMVTARRLEFSLLRSAGASPAQLCAVVFGDALLVSAFGIAAGGTLGVLLSIPMLDLLSAEFGLAVDRHLDLARLGLLALSVLLSVTLSASYPAWLARRSSEPELAPSY